VEVVGISECARNAEDWIHYYVAQSEGSGGDKHDEPSGDDEMELLAMDEMYGDSELECYD
jgi:hypothetical protein